MFMKLKQLVFFPFFICLTTTCFANSQPYTFLLHPNRVFIETGSSVGEGIQRALLSGFQEIHSIELSPKHFFVCTERFRCNPIVNLHFGDSGKDLFDIIKNINEPITFWLDGHYQGGETARGETMSPILKELHQIKRHHIKTHTLLIDDVRLFGTYEFDYTTRQMIIDAIYAINPNYTISYEDGFVKNDILVAEVK